MSSWTLGFVSSSIFFSQVAFNSLFTFLQTVSLLKFPFNFLEIGVDSLPSVFCHPLIKPLFFSSLSRCLYLKAISHLVLLNHATASGIDFSLVFTVLYMFLTLLNLCLLANHFLVFIQYKVLGTLNKNSNDDAIRAFKPNCSLPISNKTYTYIVRIFY